MQSQAVFTWNVLDVNSIGLMEWEAGRETGYENDFACPIWLSQGFFFSEWEVQQDLHACENNLLSCNLSNNQWNKTYVSLGNTSNGIATAELTKNTRTIYKMNKPVPCIKKFITLRLNITPTAFKDTRSLLHFIQSLEIASYKNYHSIEDLFKHIKALPLATFKNWSSTCLRVPQQQQSKKGNKLVLKLPDTKEKSVILFQSLGIIKFLPWHDGRQTPLTCRGNWESAEQKRTVFPLKQSQM